MSTEYRSTYRLSDSTTTNDVHPYWWRHDSTNSTTTDTAPFYVTTRLRVMWDDDKGEWILEQPGKPTDDVDPKQPAERIFSKAEHVSILCYAFAGGWIVGWLGHGAVSLLT